jgi:hypothetical protein
MNALYIYIFFGIGSCLWGGGEGMGMAQLKSPKGNLVARTAHTWAGIYIRMSCI